MKRVFLALTVIVVVVSLATAGTFAHFSDTEESQDNYLETGSLDLQLGDDAPEVIRGNGTVEYPDAEAEAYGEDPLGDSVTETWLLPNAEVDDTVTSCVHLRNVGDLSGDDLYVDCRIRNIDFQGGTSDKDEMLVINSLVYRDSSSISIVWTNVTGQHYNPAFIDDDDGDGRITLNDLELHGLVLPVPNTGFTRLCMRVTLDVPLDIDPNQYQGDETQMTLIFTLK